jgi:two-component system nitrogen regulation sensor histidine kinase NtrY
MHNRSAAPKQMAAAVQKELKEQQQAFLQLVANQDLIKRLFHESLSEDESAELAGLPFKLFAYSADELIFWNTNKVLVECGYPLSATGEQLLFHERGFFIKNCISFPYLEQNKKLVVLFPITTTHPFENNYLRSGFVAGDDIPPATRILSRPTISSYEIRSLSGKTKFYLLFLDTVTGSIHPDAFTVTLIILALLISITWVQFITIGVTRRYSFFHGLLLSLVLVIGLRALSYMYGLPFNIDELPLFSPQLYASNSFFRSLGDVLLNAICFLWIVVFMTRYVTVSGIRKINLSAVVKYILSVLAIVLMIFYCFGFINIISSLVLDSKISFDVSRFDSVTPYTILGLFTICIITITSCLVIYLFNIVLLSFIGNKWIRYLLVALIGAIILIVSEKNLTGQYSYILLIWLIFFLFALDVRSLTKIKDILSPLMIFWGVFICAFCMGVLQHFNHTKELETRKTFAELATDQRDKVTEYLFRNVAQSIAKDRTLKTFLRTPYPELRRMVNERFDALYMGGQLNKYQSKVLLFNASGVSLYNNDTIHFNTIQQQTVKAEPTEDSTLFFKEYAQDGHYYLARIPVLGDSNTNLLGFVFIDLAIKESGGESVYPELLQPAFVRGIENTNYGYGIYINNKLITQTNNYSFPIYLKDKNKRTYSYNHWGDYSELWYNADQSKTVVVAYYHKTWLESMTLFSYLFGIQMIILIIIVFQRSLLSYFTRRNAKTKFINFTLRRRIHFSMLAIVLVSFLIIGAVTIAFFTYQYKQSSRNKLQAVTQVVERSIINYLRAQGALADAKTFNQATNTAEFKYFIASLGNNQKVDINLFGASGVLSVASQETIYDKGLLARVMRPEAYFRLYRKGLSIATQDEKIGSLSYLSSYVPLHDEANNTLGYINIPFFSSEKELNVQISNILVTLINLYAFIFLISSFATVFITRWMTRTFNVVIKRFEKLNLSANELIDWPYDDEIGLLVGEYNKMVKKVEDNAALLAQSEREVAWREMAKQVAHEIKNPLTPMKLNIQYLQQALKAKHPNVEELASKVSESIIEQIDNLSYIASEFSNFAKMPEAKPEEIDLNELLERAVELYLSEKAVKVSFSKCPDKLIVYADRNQLLRVFTNLLENAIQAVPQDRQGTVKVSLAMEDNEGLISFKDNGRGISKDVIERIFEPYFTTKTSGTGLGLAMTKKMIEFWKGTIWFETEEGIGTTFFIKLPLIHITPEEQ